MDIVNIVNFLRDFRKEEIYKLFLLDEHTDEEFVDMDDYLQSNDETTIFLRDITQNPSLYMSDSIKKYFELHYDEPKEYLTNELLMLLYYMADANEMDTSDLSKELKECVNETIINFKELIQQDDENILKEKIVLFNELLSRTLPMACNHMISVAETFDKSNMYQQMMDNFGKIDGEFNKYLDTMLPTDDEKDDFLKIIHNLINQPSDTDNILEQSNDIINDLINPLNDIENKDNILEQSNDLINPVNDIENKDNILD